MSPGERLDCHQHLWPPSLLDALRRRRQAPRLQGPMLILDGEPPCPVDPLDHDAGRRTQLAVADGLERVLLSLSSPLGIEYLPPEQAEPLLEAWHEGVSELGRPFAAWAAASVVDLDPAALRTALASAGVVGLQLPACAMATPAALDRLGPLLAVLDELDRPLLVHPGPATGPGADLPGWWPALVPYVAQLNAAWYAWHMVGRSSHPRLRVCFVALAGLAPLHHERLAARGGALGRLDPDVFYETSSYGTRAVDAMARVVGVDVLVHGSDRPNAGPNDLDLGLSLPHAMRVTNPRRLLLSERKAA